MNLVITATSQFLLQCLQTPADAAVHSVYRSTVNLRTSGGRLLAIQSRGSPLSPISLVTPLSREALGRLPLEAGTPCRIAPEAVTLYPACGERLQLRYRPGVTRVYDTALRTPERPDAAFHAALADRFLRAAPPGSLGRLPAADGDLFLSAARAQLEEAAARYTWGQWEAAAEALCALVGLGIGLTPSGDDFLCGLLAGLLWRWGENCPLHRALARRLAGGRMQTNLISAAFLDCALRGQFSEAVIRFFALSPAASPQELNTCREAFGAIGHSSGFDTLAGISYGLTLPIVRREPGRGAFADPRDPEEAPL